MNQLKNAGIEVEEGRYHEEAIYSLALLYNLIDNAVSAHLNQFQLSPAKFNVLMVVKHQGGEQGISQVDISKRLIVTSSNMTRLLDRLEQEKLIFREDQQGDRRVNLVRISERGSALLDAAWPGYTKTLKDLMSAVPEPDQKTLTRVLSRWLEAVKK